MFERIKDAVLFIQENPLGLTFAFILVSPSIPAFVIPRLLLLSFRVSFFCHSPA